LLVKPEGDLTMIKKLLAISVAAVGLSTGALAADMRMPMKAPPAPIAAVFSWTGFYVGINGGWGWGRSHR
jgi:outer membrane immunogenic protein